MIPVNADAFRGLCDHAFWHNAEPQENPCFQNGDVVFCKIDEVWRLFRALRRTRKRIILVTGEGDKPVSPELWKQRPPHVSVWFGMNMFAMGDSAYPIPLGLGNASGTITPNWGEIQTALDSSPARTKLLYANFGTRSNPAIREPLQEWVGRSDQNWITRQPHSNAAGKAGYLQDLLSHHFILCPPGNGEDTHRMWEALYCGAVPVVRKSPAMRDFHELPILFVDDFTSLTPAFLENKIGSWDSFSCQQLDSKFWQNRFEVAKEHALRLGRLELGIFLQAWGQEIRRVIFKK
ncbi:MAG: exostosin family protein [Chthoniobacterales bacterium]